MKYKPFVLVVLVVLGMHASCEAKEHRIDSQATFDALRMAKFQPGDTILFQKGLKLKGMFSPTGNGTEAAPIRIGTHGEGALPRIDAGGKCKAGLLLRNPSYWEVAGLEITNTDGSDKDQGDLFGIFVVAEDKEGTYRHVYITDCHVHDVNGKVAGKRRGGIHIHVKGLKVTTFHDLRILRNRVERVGGVGIGNTSSCGCVEFLEDRTVGHHLWTKVHVADNYVGETGRNAIIARTSKDAVYERNVLAHSSRYDTGHSIFCFNTDAIKIQYNEAYGNVGKEGKDRGGFDADYNCVNTHIQYNYSHDNMWFCGIMKRHNRNVVIRYNVSQNDREGIYFYGFESQKKARDIHIYNNTHFVRKGLKVQVLAEDRTPLNSRFENNIFYFEDRGTWGKRSKGINTVFHHNLYYNVPPHSSETQAIEGDPRFLRPGQAGTGIDLRTLEGLRGYGLRVGSPCIDAGVPIQSCGGKDLLGNEVPSGKADVGAIEWRRN